MSDHSVNQCAKPALRESAVRDQIFSTNIFSDDYTYSPIVFTEDKKCNVLKVLGGKMNEEGPDLFGWYGHCERVVSRSSSAVVCKKKIPTCMQQCRLRCAKHRTVQTNARRRCFTGTFSHLFLHDLLSSTSTSAKWSRPRFLWENAPPALSLPLSPEEHPSHTGNDILKRSFADYFKALPIKKRDNIRWGLQLLNVCEHLDVDGDWLGQLRVLSLLKEMHDPHQDSVVVGFWVQAPTWGQIM